MTDRRAITRVVVFGLGGTISMTAQPSGGIAPSIPLEHMLDGGTEGRADVRAVQFRQCPGPHLRMADVLELAVAIDTALRDGAGGVVVVQGTDTIEETSFLLDRLHARDEPVVVTGAMRPPSLPGPDGPGNMAAAIAVASSVDTRGLGVTVVMDDLVHAARFVAKGHTGRPGAFMSRPGEIGHLAEGRVRILTRPARLPALAARQIREVWIAHVSATLGDDGRTVEAVASAGCDGLVVSAMGSGHVPPGMVEALTALARRIPVVVASRAGSGETFRATYGYAGAEMDLGGRDIRFAGWLPPVKAHALLHLLVSTGADLAEIDRNFAAFGGGGPL